MKRIQAKKHKIGAYEIDKRFVLDDGVNTLAYFHKNCNKKCDKNENKNENENNNNHNNDNDNEEW